MAAMQNPVSPNRRLVGTFLLLLFALACPPEARAQEGMAQGWTPGGISIVPHLGLSRWPDDLGVLGVQVEIRPADRWSVVAGVARWGLDAPVGDCKSPLCHENMADDWDVSAELGANRWLGRGLFVGGGAGVLRWLDATHATGNVRGGIDVPITPRAALRAEVRYQVVPAREVHAMVGSLGLRLF